MTFCAGSRALPLVHTCRTTINKQQKHRPMASPSLLQDLTPQDFLPISVLGHGDIGTVFLVQLCKDNKSYAMKVMQKEVLRRKGEKRAAVEKQVLSMLSHPFLPKLHAHFDSEKHVFFIMDFCSGGDLNALRQKQPLKRFSESITREACGSIY